MEPELTIVCEPRAALLTKHGCERCRGAAELAIIALKELGVGGVPKVGKAIMNCLAACSVCDLWESEEKGFFAEALQQDLDLLYDKMVSMNKNWCQGDSEMSLISKQKSWKKFAATEHRKEYMVEYNKKRRKRRKK